MANRKKKLYYAHSMITYGTRKERRELNRIRKRFPDHEIINPAEVKFAGNGAEMMQVCIEIVKQVDVVVLSEYRKHIGRGVYLELEAAVRGNVERYLLRGRRFMSRFVSRTDDPDDWKVRYARIIGVKG